MSKRGRSRRASVPQIVVAIKEALNKDLSAEETKALHRVIKGHLQAEDGAAESLYKLIIHAFNSWRHKEKSKKRALAILDFTFNRSKDFRLSVCSKLRELIRKCCNGCENNSRDINSNPLALQLFMRIHDWDRAFGNFYPELRAVARYYRESVKVLDAEGVLYCTVCIWIVNM